jgi:hypothetical protein
MAKGSMMNLNDEVVAEFRANSGTVTQAMDGALSHLELACYITPAGDPARPTSFHWHTWPTKAPIS